MTKLFASALIAISLLATGASATTAPKSSIRQECRQANPTDHKAYRKCVAEKKAEAKTERNANAAQKAAPATPATPAKSAVPAAQPSEAPASKTQAN